MRALLKIELIQTKRNLSAFVLAIGMPVLFFLLFSSLVDVGDYQAVFVRDYLMTMTAFSMSGFGFFTFPTMLHDDVKNHWFLQIAHSPVPIWQYYLAKILRTLICFVIAIVINFLIGSMVKHVDLPMKSWFLSAILLLIGSSFYLAMGLLLAQIKSEQLMSVLSNLLYMGLAILGGSWMPVRTFPTWLQNISKITPTYHANYLVTHFLEEGEFAFSSLAFVLIYAIILLGLALFIKKRTEVR